MKKEDEEYEIKWWKDWLEADGIKRTELVENLPIVNEILNLNKLPEEIRKHSFALMLNSFFEDLESAVYTKISLDKRKSKTSE